MRTRLLVVLFPVLLAVAPGALGGSLCVRPGGTGLKNGAGWDNAFATIGAALAVAQSGDDVLVASGTYQENLTLPSGVHMIGGYYETSSGWQTLPGNSVLDGNQNGPVIAVAANAAYGTSVRGFTFENGNGRLIRLGNPPFYRFVTYGGAVYAPSGSIILAENNFWSNSADIGGAVYVAGYAEISGNVLSRNQANDSGGGVACGKGTVYLFGNRLTQNTAGAGGGGVAVFSAATNAGLISNQFDGNSGTAGSGLWTGKTTEVTNNTFVYNTGAPAVEVNDGTRATFENNIIAFNSHGLYAGTGAVAILKYNDVYANAAYNYSGLADATNQEHNISVDPMFFHSSNFHLRSYSPCLDAGDPSYSITYGADAGGAPRVSGDRVDIGAWETTMPAPLPSLKVRPDGNNANNGFSWATAKRTIQAAIDAAGGTYEVWVAQGTYSDTSSLSGVTYGPVRIINTNVAIYGGFDGTEISRSERDPKANPTILDCSADSVVYISGSAIDGRTVIDGFTITGGIGHLPSTTSNNGGGIYMVDASPRISNNIIQRNQAGKTDGYGPGQQRYRVGYGGGIYSDGGDPVIAANVVARNAAFIGGGIYSRGDQQLIAYNQIIDNYTYYYDNPPTDGWNGAGLYFYASSIGSVEHNAIQRNEYGKGAGIYLKRGTVICNLITDNEGLRGGGIYLDDAAAVVSSNVIAHNRATEQGGGVRAWHSTAYLYNNTIAENSAGTGAGISLAGDQGRYRNNIVAFNGGTGFDSATDDPSTPSLALNDVFGNSADYANVTAASNDISKDPLFWNRPGADYHLQAASPCVDAGDDSASGVGYTDMDGWPRQRGNGVDMGAYEMNLATQPSVTDVVNSLRIAAGLAFSDSLALGRDNVETTSPSATRIDLADVCRLARRLAGL